MACTQMFALCGNRTRDLLRSRRLFPPLRHIARQLHLWICLLNVRLSYQIEQLNIETFKIDNYLICFQLIGNETTTLFSMTLTHGVGNKLSLFKDRY
jgi:hypothetical protein